MTLEFDTYLEVNTFLNGHIYPFIKNNYKEIEDYNYVDYFDSVIFDNDIDVFGQPFRDTSKGAISGILMKDELGISLTYNSRHPHNRQNFTKCHELIHFLKHIDEYGTEFSIEETSFYYDDSNIMEYEANAGAAQILLPDIVLAKNLKKTQSFQKIAETYSMSEGALYYRIRDFLVFTCNLAPQQAIRLVIDYQRYGKKEWIYRAMNHFNAPYEKQIWNEFENT